jgi:hypothetical protein
MSAEFRRRGCMWETTFVGRSATRATRNVTGQVRPICQAMAGRGQSTQHWGAYRHPIPVCRFPPREAEHGAPVRSTAANLAPLRVTARACHWRKALESRGIPHFRESTEQRAVSVCPSCPFSYQRSQGSRFVSVPVNVWLPYVPSISRRYGRGSRVVARGETHGQGMAVRSEPKFRRTAGATDTQRLARSDAMCVWADIRHGELARRRLSKRSGVRGRHGDVGASSNVVASTSPHGPPQQRPRG